MDSSEHTTGQVDKVVCLRAFIFHDVSDVVGGRNVVFVSETARMYVVQRFS